MSSQLRTVHSDDVYRITFYRSFAFVDVAGNVTLTPMRAIDDAISRQIEAVHPLGIIGLLRPGAPVPPAETRKHASQLVARHGDAIAQIALVIEEGGILTTMYKTIAHGINLMSGMAKMRVHERLDDALAALCRLLFPPRDVSDELTAVRAAISAARASYRPTRSLTGRLSVPARRHH